MSIIFISLFSMTMSVQTGLLDKADGSAQLISGNSKVVVSVTGPIEAKPKQELINTSSLEVVVRPHQGFGNTREKLLEDKLRNLLQTAIVGYKYPRQVIQVVVQFLSVSGENPKYTNVDLSDAINAAFYALIDADIALYYSFVCSYLCVINNKIIREPLAHQLHQSSSHHLVCFSIEDKKVEKILLLESQGDFSQEELFDVVATASGSAEKEHRQQRKEVEAKIKNDYVWRNK